MKNNKPNPPQMGDWILRRLLNLEDYKEKSGDFEEVFSELHTDSKRVKVYLWYWLQLVLVMVISSIRQIFWSYEMFKNYMKIALRNIKRHKGFSSINIGGLAIGIACCVLILLYVSFELSFDRFHEKSDQIYRIVVHGQIIDVEINQISTPKDLSETLLVEYPEVEQAIKILNRSGSMISFGEESFQNERIYAVDPEFFEVFSFPLLAGDPTTVLSETNSAVITRDAAEKYFGSEDPINKTIRMRGIDFKITGILENIPENSHLQFNILLNVDSFPYNSRPWNNNMYATYIILPKGYDKDIFDQKLEDIVNKYVLPVNSHFRSWKYYLEPFEDVHLRSELKWRDHPEGNIIYVYVFSCIAFFILLIACINFMILSTAKSTVRAKEIGVRKVIGSNRIMLIKQFMSESFLMCIFAMFLAVILVELSLPFFRTLVEKNIQLHYLNNFYVIPGLVLLTLFVSFFSGSYPAFHLSSIQVVSVLKGGSHQKNKRNLFRNGLVVFQFSVTVLLIVSSLIIYNQLRFFQNKKLGFNKEQQIVIHDPGLLAENYSVFKESLKQYSNILNVSGSSTIPGRGFSNQQITPENSDRIHFDFLKCDYDYLETMDIELAAGRFFSPEYGSDENAIVINEVVAKQLGWSDPLGKNLTFGRQELHVIGMIRDIHYRSLHREIDKLGILLSNPDRRGRGERYVTAKIRSVNIQKTIEFISNTWDSFSPPISLNYSFLDEDFDSLYRAEERTGNIALIFTVLAVFISCIGLLGLAAYMAERRTKEIGIRKILGCSISELLVLLLKDVFSLVIISCLIAWPLSYYFMNIWLREFAYKVSLGLEIFIIPGLITMIIAVSTVGFQAVKSAIANPVDSLRYEVFILPFLMLFWHLIR